MDVWMNKRRGGGGGGGEAGKDGTREGGRTDGQTDRQTVAVTVARGGAEGGKTDGERTRRGRGRWERAVFCILIDFTLGTQAASRRRRRAAAPPRHRHRHGHRFFPSFVAGAAARYSRFEINHLSVRRPRSERCLTD